VRASGCEDRTREGQQTTSEAEQEDRPGAEQEATS
jgi:hypothetical protein